MSDGSTTYGSDVVVDIMARLGLKYASLNPGASFRGIHESMVHAGSPEPITCLFEGTAVAIAHGYAKATGKPMAVLLHNLVGLQHASMGIFNAYSDAVPMVVIGGAGPVDRSRRRPWIDWVHTPANQGLAVRPFVKWDSQPVAVAEFPEVFSRAFQIASSGIPGPTYVAVDSVLQEHALGDGECPDLDGVKPRVSPSLTVPDDVLREVANHLAAAERPVILVDHTGRSEAAYQATLEIAEHLAIPVVDLGGRHSFPNNHWADLTFDRVELLKSADVVLCLDPRDTTWATTTINQEDRGWNSVMPHGARLIVISLNELAVTSFIEREAALAIDDHITADTAAALPRLAEMILSGPSGSGERRRQLASRSAELREKMKHVEDGTDVLSEGQAVAAVYGAISDGPWQLAFAGFRPWVRRTWVLDRWNAHLGGSGGAGLGYGPGAAVGAALGHKGSDTLVVTIQPDGDLLYDPTALWTAAHHEIPLLMVVIDNGTYTADRIHQARMARMRGGRSIDVAHIGVDFDSPRIDIAQLAESQGVMAWTVATPDELSKLTSAVSYIRESGKPAVVVMKSPPASVSGLG